MNRRVLRVSSMTPDLSRMGCEHVSDLISLVEEYIEKHRLLPAPLLVVGVSGGADSMALLFVLKDICSRKYPDMPILVAHMNHGIREEAGEDERLVAEYGRSLGLPVLVKHVSIPEISEKEGLSLETAGRIARYEFLESVSGDEGTIAVAHHMDDQAESVAMHIFRGCGMEGLVGIRPKNGNVIHPFLGISKKQILDFCKERGIPFCNDVTNADITYDRNFWRHEIFPKIEDGTSRNPVAALVGLSERISEENDFLDALAERELEAALASGTSEDLAEEPMVPVSKLQVIPRPLRRRVLRLMAVRTYGDVVDIESTHWDAILDLTEKTSGSSYVHLPRGRVAAREAGCIRYLTKAGAFAAENGGYVDNVGICVPESVMQAEVRLSDLTPGEKVNFSQSFVQMRLRSVEKGERIVYNNLTWFFPSSVLKDVVIRTRRQGDTILRAGNTCTKELRRFMNEVHIPSRFRDRILLAARGNEILWLPMFGHAVGFTDEISEAKYGKTLSEDGEDELFALEFFEENA